MGNWNPVLWYCFLSIFSLPLLAQSRLPCKLILWVQKLQNALFDTASGGNAAAVGFLIGFTAYSVRGCLWRSQFYNLQIFFWKKKRGKFQRWLGANSLFLDKLVIQNFHWKLDAIKCFKKNPALQRCLDALLEQVDLWRRSVTCANIHCFFL